MKKLIVIIALISPLSTLAQSETTRKFQKKHDGAFSLFFYNNTLRMLNMEGNEEFDLLIKDIDKMKLIRVNKDENNFTKNDFNQLVKEYKAERFEDLMTMRQSGMNINVYIQEDDGVTTGLVLLMNDEESISVLDIKGKVPLNKLANLISQIQKAEGF